MSRRLSTTNVGLIGRAAARSVSLFGVDEDKTFRELSLDCIRPNPAQPRTVFDSGALAELAASITRHGVLQPILVRETAPDAYEIIAGERRFRASGMAGRATIPAIVTTADDPTVLALLENIQREDLEPLDLAQFLDRLLAGHGATHDELAALIGKSRPYVTRVLGLLRLPQVIRDDLADNRAVSLSVLLEIAEADDEALQVALWTQAKGGITVKALRQAKQEGAKQDGTKPEGTASASPTEKLLRNSRFLMKELDRVSQQGHRLDDEQRAALQALRDRIDATLGG